MTDTFDRAFAAVVGEEGGYTTDPRDPGNYTPSGVLRGTKYGISARAFPALDIANLTLEGARAIYQSRYWAAVRGDELPPPLALLLFDAAVNSGPGQAIRWLQAALGVAVDGKFGPATMAAVEAARGRGVEVQADFQARRMVTLASLPTWKTYGLGWARRMARMPYLAMETT